MDDDDQTSPPGNSERPEIPYQTNSTARERRAAFAKTHSVKQVSNGITETVSGIPESSSLDGKSVAPSVQAVTSGRRKTSGAGKRKDREFLENSDSAAPQTYGVSVRL